MWTWCELKEYRRYGGWENGGGRVGEICVRESRKGERGNRSSVIAVHGYALDVFLFYLCLFLGRFSVCFYYIHIERRRIKWNMSVIIWTRFSCSTVHRLNCFDWNLSFKNQNIYYWYFFLSKLQIAVCFHVFFSFFKQTKNDSWGQQRSL